MKDEWGIVLDFLLKGHVGHRKEEPLTQVLGDKFFSLLEIVVRPEVNLMIEDRIYIGNQKREQVKYIKRSLSVDELTAAARNQLELSVEGIVNDDEARFVEFFNKGGPITTRLHMLEMIPGVGKKHLWNILDARKEKPFESYDDIKERVPLMIGPAKMISGRIMQELENDDERYYIFVAPRKRREDF